MVRQKTRCKICSLVCEFLLLLSHWTVVLRHIRLASRIWVPNWNLTLTRMVISLILQIKITSARLKEIGTRWNQRCLIFQCVPMFFEGRSFASVFIFVSSWYAKICIIKFNIFEIKFNFERWWGWGLRKGALLEGAEPLPSNPSQVKRNLRIHAFRLYQAFYPDEKCWSHVSKTIFTRQPPIPLASQTENQKNKCCRVS